MKYHEYVYCVFLMISMSSLVAMAWGWQHIAGNLTLALIGLLMVAIKQENVGTGGNG